jgi:hypothetical protein
MHSFVILDQSGSMFRSWRHARIMAQALMSTASPANPIAFLSFNNRVYLQNYYETNATPLLNKLRTLGTPSGLSEVCDSLLVALTVDAVKPDRVYIISDMGENASEVKAEAFPLLRKYGVQWLQLRPPVDTALVAPAYLMPEPPARIPVLKEIGAKVHDFTKFTDVNDLNKQMIKFIQTP